MRRAVVPAATMLGIALSVALLTATTALQGAESEGQKASPAIAALESAPEYPPYDGPGFKQARGKKTGFFHLEKQGDKWWLVDPNGKGFYILAVNSVDYYGPSSALTGRTPYHEAVSQNYADEEAWAEETIARLADWGFTALGASSSESLRHRRLPHVEWYCTHYFGLEDNIVPPLDPYGTTGFPNVFSPDWPAYCDERAEQACAPNRDDPWLIGYYLDNELPWYGSTDIWVGEFGMVRNTWMKPADHTAKQAWIALVRDLCRTIEDFNRAWGTEFTSFDDLAASTEPVAPRSDEANEMVRQYLRLVAERYFSATTAAVRRHDPNHLILGVRFAETAPDFWDICGRYSDVVSVNKYPDIDLARGIQRQFVEFLQQRYEEARAPLFITEWTFIAQSDDLAVPPGHAVGWRLFDQEQRARCSAIFQQTMLSLPFVVGTSWWAYADYVRDVSDDVARNGNNGLVNRHDEPYEEVTSALVEVHRQAADLHAAGVLDYVYDPPPSVRWGYPIPEREVEASDEAVRLVSGMLELSSTHDGAWTVKYDGHVVGTWRPVVRRGWGEETAIVPTACSIADVRRDAQFTVLDAEFSGRNAERAVLKTGWRFWAPNSGSGWCGVECLWLENAGAAGLDATLLLRWSHREGGPQDDPGEFSLANAQRFYIPLLAVDYPEAGVGLGVTLVGEGAEFIHHRADPATAHSYCRQIMNLHLDPGQRQPIEGSLMVLFGYGAEGRGGLYEALKYRVEEVRAEVHVFCEP